MLRVRPGERIVLFNGLGQGVAGEIVQVSKRVVEVLALSREPEPPTSPVRLTLAVGLPDRKRAQRMVEALGELGVERLIPLRSERGGEPVPAETLARWALESAKQSGRNSLLEITEPHALTALKLEGAQGWLADPEGPEWFASRLSGAPAPRLTVAVGPAGGFTPAERDALVARGFLPLRLAPLVLRVETAAVSAAACVVGAWPPEAPSAPNA
ncbi:MAG: 16S rRNA (uracil(1498)-N(3))-methyltransferase [Planctomycetes bacterium]|nr:16S rRNA (uracil(1498)-N(3))-methyltransferase [Planctomycetota bacterium]